MVANFVVPEGEAAAPLMHAKGALALTDTAFANNSLPGAAAGAVFVSGAGTLRLDRTTFTGTTSEHAVLAATPRNAVYSDDASATYAVLAQGAGTVGGPGGGRTVQTRRTRVLAAAEEEPFLLGNDTWLLELQQVRRLLQRDVARAVGCRPCMTLWFSRVPAKRHARPTLGICVVCESPSRVWPAADDSSHMGLPLMLCAYTSNCNSSRHACARFLRANPLDVTEPARRLSALLAPGAQPCQGAR